MIGLACAGKRDAERPANSKCQGATAPTDASPEFSPVGVDELVSRSSSSPRPRLSSVQFWRRVHHYRRMLRSAVIADVSSGIPNDSRPFARVAIGGQHVLGLLDSGATISCFGRNGIERVEQLGLTLKKVGQSGVMTADGTPQRIHGFVDVDVEYGGKIKLVRLYVIPSLSQDLYLGIDFWREFGLAPQFLEELDAAKVLPDPGADLDPNTHVLSLDQRRALDEVKAEFLSSEQQGLGKTTVLKHLIDVGTTNPIKQRHHFVSPAIQAVLNQEVDSILARGIIEESRSAWSSPVLVVRKSNGKMRFCLDCRAVNKVTVKDAYPMPLIDGILANLHETSYEGRFLANRT